MPLTFHVNGTAVVSVGPSGTGGSLTQLGITEGGVVIQINGYMNPIMTDAAGMNVPADYQDMGSDAFIELRLPVYDVAVLAALRRRGNASVEGRSGSNGRIVRAGGHAFRLVIASEFDEPWRFLCCTMIGDPQTVKLGTENTKWGVRFRAWPPVGPGVTAREVALYDHIAG